MSLLQRNGKFLHRFADYLQIADDSILRLGVLQELLVGKAIAIGNDALHGLLNVAQVVFISPLR